MDDGGQRSRYVKFLRNSDMFFVLRLETLTADLFEIAKTCAGDIVFFKTKNLRRDPKD